MRRIFILALLSISTFGCADTHEFVRNSPADTVSKLSGSDSFYVAVSRDGIYGSKTYQGSGVMTAQILMSSFAKHVRNVQADRAYRSFDDSLRMAKQAKYKYLVYPTILEWEDRATEWSAIPDRVSIKIEIINVESAQTVESAIVKGKSGLATFGGDHPQDLLPKPVDEFVSALF